MNPFDIAYKNELVLIKANGGNKTAVEYRYEQLEDTRRMLLNDIVRRSVEITARDKALKECMQKLRRD